MKSTFLCVVWLLAASLFTFALGKTPTTIPASSNYRLQFGGMRIPNLGLQVKSVVPKGPCTKMRDRTTLDTGVLEVGDVVTAIDGQAIQSDQHYFQMLRRSGGRPVDVSIRDVNSRKTFVWSVAPALVRGVTGTVHALLVGRIDEPDIGRGVHLDLANMQSVISAIPVPESGTISRLTSHNATPSNVIATVRSLPVDTDDTVVCYLSCHGAYDPAASSDSCGGHYFQLYSGALRRSRLLTELRSLNARLTVLISESCNAPGYSPMGRSIPGQSSRQRTEYKHLEDLFMLHKGIVNVNSCSRGTYAWQSSDIGGWFTNSFRSLALTPNQHAGWPSFLNRVGAATNNLFQTRTPGLTHPALVHQRAQLPQVFEGSTQRVRE